MNQITEFYVAAEEIEKRNSEVTEDSFMWKSHPYGGGRVHLDTVIAGDALVSLFSKVHRKAHIGSKAKIINSILGQDSRIEAEAQILNTPFGIRWELAKNSTVDSFSINESVDFSVQLKDASKIENTKFFCAKSCSLILGERSSIKGSEIQMQDLTTQQDVKIIDSRIKVQNLNIGTSSEIKKSKIDLEGQVISIRNDQKMSDGLLDETSFDFAPLGFKVKNISDSINFGPYKSGYINIKDVKSRLGQTIIYSNPGYHMKLTYDVTVKKKGLFSKYGHLEFSNCRLDFEVRSFESAPVGLFTLENDFIHKAGSRKVIVFEQDFLLGFNSTIQDALSKLAIRNGLKFIGDKAYLPYEP